MDPTGLWNREVTSQERATAISKLQRFLMSIVGDGADSVTRATDLANKFEQHVYTSTSTREEYLRVIVSRMQQIQQRRKSLSEEPPNNAVASGIGLAPPQNSAYLPSAMLAASTTSTLAPPPSNMSRQTSASSTNNMSLLSESEMIQIKQKIHILMFQLPRINSILADIKLGKISPPPSQEIIKSLVGLKALIEKQSDLLKKNVFIVNLNNVNNALDQLQNILSTFPDIVEPPFHEEDGGDKRRVQKKSNSNSIVLDEEQSILAWLRSRKKSKVVFTERENTSRLSTSLQRLGGGLTANADESNKIDSYLKSEFDFLLEQYRQHEAGLKMIMRKRTWGHELLIQFTGSGKETFVIELPPDYPSANYFSRSVDNKDSKFKNIKVFPPVSLTALLSILTFTHCQDHDLFSVKHSYT